MSELKKFIDIQAARIESDELKESNVGAFRKGDIIQITRKIDGSNASINYDPVEKKLECFSRRMKLKPSNTLSGFLTWVDLNLNPEDYADVPSFYIFGEWNLCCNKIKDYKEKFQHTWIVYDIFDRSTERWLKQDEVKAFCKSHNLQYIQELYYGPFTGWEDVEKYLENDGYYGGTAEGVVIKNQSALDRGPATGEEGERNPAYLKIVNASFKESMKRKPKVVDSNKELKYAENVALVETIVTERRVEKAIEKLRDDGVLPEKLTPQDMGLVAKYLPREIYNDCLKEEKETAMAVGELFGKIAATTTMRIARRLILGQ